MEKARYNIGQAADLETSSDPHMNNTSSPGGSGLLVKSMPLHRGTAHRMAKRVIQHSYWGSSKHHCQCAQHRYHNSMSSQDTRDLSAKHWKLFEKLYKADPELPTCV